MQSELANGHGVFLSTEVAGRRAFWYALAAVLCSVVSFSAAAPFAAKPLASVPAFIPAYESVLVICDLITAVLLFGQFKVSRSRALFVLANGYLFTAFIAFVHALTFPGVFSPTGLLGAGPQSTAWLYMFWHGGFPLFVTAYALLEVKGPNVVGTRGAIGPPRREVGIVILAGGAAVLALVGALALIATANHHFLFDLIADNHFTPAMTIIVSGIWALSLLALAILAWRRPYTALDLWLMVVMCAWLFDIALSAVLNAGRFDLGWYAGRIYGLLAASVLLIVLLVETNAYHARLVRLSSELMAANESLEQLSLYDGLTNLANRRFFDSYLADQIAVARRHGRALALVICDIDSFKAYNDHFGHQPGDECLKQVAAAIRSCCRRPGDMVARYGGEEFAIVLPDTDLAGAVRIAESARMAIALLAVAHPNSRAAPHVTISGGVAIMQPKVALPARHLIAAADRMLYQAKHLGRNRIVSAHTEPEAQHLSAVAAEIAA